MNKALSVAGNLVSMLALFALIAYVGLNTAYDLGTISQSADSGLFRNIRDMLVIPGFALGLIGLGLSGTYVTKNKDELGTVEMAAPIAIPALTIIGLGLFVFVL